MRRTRTFPAVPQSVPAARRFAVGALADSPAPILEAVELMVSELATNCIRHEHSSFHLVILRTSSEIRIEVTDSGPGTPTMRSPGPHEPSGRGLQIVDILSERWGVERELPSGKTVWFTLDVPAPHESAADGGSRQRPEDQSAPITGRAPGVHRRRPSSMGPSSMAIGPSCMAMAPPAWAPPAWAPPAWALLHRPLRRPAGMPPASPGPVCATGVVRAPSAVV